MTCPDCNRPLATETDHQSTREGEGTHLCWSSFGDRCLQPIDWRARALATEARIAELAATLGADPSQPIEDDLDTIDAALRVLADYQATIQRLTAGALADGERIRALVAQVGTLRSRVADLEAAAQVYMAHIKHWQERAAAAELALLRLEVAS